MTVRGFPNLKIELSTAASVLTAANAPASPNFTDISTFVTELTGWNQQRNFIDTTGAKDSFSKYDDVGIVQHPEITIAGPYNDAASSLVALLKGKTGDQRTIKLTWDDPSAADIQRVQVLVKSVGRNPRQNELTNFTVVLQPIGSIAVT